MITVEAPTDAQLLTIRHMCAERDLEPPAVVWSKAEGRAIFDAIKAGTYSPADYRAPGSPGIEDKPEQPWWGDDPGPVERWPVSDWRPEHEDARR